MNQLQLLLVQTEIALILAFILSIASQRPGWDAPMGSGPAARAQRRDAGTHWRSATRWAIQNIGSPGVCFAAIAGGVLCANHLAWQVVGLAVTRPLPVLEAAPGVDLALAVLVFNRGGYRRWQAAAAMPLLPRALAAFGLGLTWPLVVGTQAR